MTIEDNKLFQIACLIMFFDFSASTFYIFNERDPCIVDKSLDAI